MLKNTNENDIKEKLAYIDLDLAKIPSFLKKEQKLDYKPLKSIEQKEYKVYKYIPISKIKILLTPCNRLNTIKEKYEKADSISAYLDAKSEQNILKHTTFLKMLKEVEINKIKEIEEEQKKLQKKIPFLVKFKGNYLWQIYYSDVIDTYFMLVPTEDLDYSAFFYILKKQIELKKSKKEEYIFTPISHEEYVGEYLKKSQISDLEKYIWQITKNWPITYEVQEKDNNTSIQIVGKIAVYDEIESQYKIKLKTKEEAEKFYKLLKALFILSNELPHYYQFETKINAQGSVEFEYQKKKMTYDKLMEILVQEYRNIKQNIGQLQEKQETIQQELENAKQQSLIKEEEYLAKERLIATYLECKKTFFGKVKYFFKAKKLKKLQNIDKPEIPRQEKKDTKTIERIKFLEKEYYTIEDVIEICKMQDMILQTVKNLELDIEAQNQKVKSLTKKIENASLYLSEIDKHEKSIFEFWRFANKDEQNLLQEPEEGQIIKKKLEKVFDYQEDYEEITSMIDKKQRKILTKEDDDAIFIMTTNLLKVLNEDEKILEESLQELKKEAQNERILFDQESFDLFGNTQEDNTKVQQLVGKKHREQKKDKLKILEMTKNITKEEYKDKISKILVKINETLPKLLSPISIPIYCAQDELREELQVFYMRPQEAILEEKEKKQINLLRLNVKKQMPIVFFTNSIYYDNYNKTLPLGMDVTSKCLLDLRNYELTLAKKDNFKIVKIEEETKMIITKINLYEYEIRKKGKA